MRITGRLIKKLESYCQENGDNLKISAAGASAVEKIISDYDVVLVQRLLQHSSPNVTQKYIGIGSKKLENALNDNIILV